MSQPPSGAAPPGVAVRLAEWLIDDRVREAIVGDMLETFAARPVDAGARRQFWRETLFAIVKFPRRPRLPHAAGDGHVSGFIQDLVRSARTLRRMPAFTIACALTLALGIGAATAIFSVADPLLIRPLPYPSPGRLFMAWERDAAGQRSNVGFATFSDVRAQAKSFERSAAVGGWAPTLVRNGSAEQLRGLRVSASYFATMGVHPAIGRDFSADEDVPSRNSVVIISHELWQSHFGSDTAVVGSNISIGGTSMIVAGVMPAGYDDVLSPGAQVWRVLGYSQELPYACRTCRHLRMVARLRPDASAATAQAELNIISSALVRDHPQEYPAAGFTLVQLQVDVARRIHPALTALLVAAALLLVIATVNAGGLQLARSLLRDEEFAVRTAVGAESWRLTRLLVAEGLVLALLAGVGGWIIARIGVAQLVRRLPPSMPRLGAVHLDLRAGGIAFLVTIAAGIAIGMVPAWHARRRSLAVSLRGSHSVNRAPQRVRAALVVTEVALAVILLCGAGLLTRSLARVLAVNPGVEVGTVATATVQVSGARYADNAAVWEWQDRVVEATRAIPGVKSAALASQLPLGGNFDTYGIQAKDKPLANPELAPSADRFAVTPDFLRTMRIPLVEGRDFVASDNTSTAPDVVIVSAALAQQIWPGEHAVGKQIHMGEPMRPWFTVVGIAGNVHHQGLDVGQTEQVYIPARHFFFADNVVDVVVRVAGDPGPVLPALRRAVRSGDPETVVLRLATMPEIVATSTAQRRLAVSLFSVFAAVALFLAAAGIFGALAGTVSERKREIGLRSALGATPRQIVRLVVRQGIVMTVLGTTVGLAISFALAGAIATLLFDVRAGDLLTTAGTVVVIGAAAVAASVVPAWRALQVDPVQALRE